MAAAVWCSGLTVLVGFWLVLVCNTMSLPQLRVAKHLSGSCLCRSVSWDMKDVLLGQILVCHCSMCKRVSGSSHVPFLSVEREPLFSKLHSSPSLKKYQASQAASRYFCSICSSFVCMEYHHETQTLWVPMGTLVDTDPKDIIVDPAKDSHIFQEDEEPYEAAIEALEHCKFFGTYRTDACDRGKSWDDMKPWDEEIK